MDLAVKSRQMVGKGVKALRKEGLIPAELYGHGVKNVHLSVQAKEFAKVFKEAGTNTVVTLLIDKEKKPAIIHDMVRNYLSGEIDHVDFYQVKMDEKIKSKIPLEFVGVSIAVKEKQGILNKSMTEIEVEAFPQDLPHRLTVDISTLDDLNKSVYVRDIKIPKGVEVLVAPDTAVVTATPPLAEEEVVAPAVDVADVKVETEEKQAERQAAKAEKGEKTEKEAPAPKPASK